MLETTIEDVCVDLRMSLPPVWCITFMVCVEVDNLGANTRATSDWS